MLKRSFFKILFFLLVPSVAALLFVYYYWTRFFPNLPPNKTAEHIAETLVGLSAALLFISLVSGLLSPEFSRRHFKVEVPQLLRDLIRYGLFIVIAALILNQIWEGVLTPVVGALGIGGVVLGFALQETLSNFFAGLALLLEQPFSQGDWIRIGDRAEGQVEHITWRATKIRTRDNDYQIFPNNVVAKEIILNYRMPSRVHAIRIRVGTSYNDSPDLVKKTLLDILPGVPAVLKRPAPSVYVKEYADFSINYEMRCFIEEYDRRPEIEDQILHRIWFAFKRHGIEIPFPIRTVYHSRIPAPGPPEERLARIESAILAVPIFAALSAEERALLASCSRLEDFGGGEMVIRQGDPGETLYTILSGSVRISVRSEDGPEKTVAHLGAGEFFGEMSLLTGDPRSASVYAEEPLVLCAVSKSALLPILQSNPAAAEKTAELVTLRRQGLDKLKAETALDAEKRVEVQGAARKLFDRIKLFFGLA